jgi:hypothetical protein
MPLHVTGHTAWDERTLLWDSRLVQPVPVLVVRPLLLLGRRLPAVLAAACCAVAALCTAARSGAQCSAGKLQEVGCTPCPCRRGRASAAFGTCQHWECTPA